MNDVVLYLTKDKKIHIRYNRLEDLENMNSPAEYIDNKVLKEIDSVKEKWEIQKVEKIGDDDDFRQKLKMDFKLLLRKK